MTSALSTAEPPATSARHVVELRHVAMRFGDKQVLDYMSLAVAPQERLVIIGTERRREDHDPAVGSRNPETECGLSVFQATRGVANERSRT